MQGLWKFMACRDSKPIRHPCKRPCEEPPSAEPLNAFHVLQYHRSRTAALVCRQGASANQRRATPVKWLCAAIRQPGSRKDPLLSALEQAGGPV